MGNSDVTIRVLGPVTVAGAEEPLGPKQKLLLGALALRDGVVPIELLADLLWPAELPANPRATLQVHVSKLRRAVQEADASIRRQGEGYALVADPGRVDLAAFERLVAEGRAQATDDPARGRDVLARALDLWRGRPVEGLADRGPLAGEVARLDDTRIAALQARVEADLRLGRGAEAVAELRQLTQEHPLHEGFWRQLLLALYAAGRGGEALAGFEQARRILADELGADPGPELQALHRQILVQDPELRSPPGTSPVRAAPPASAPEEQPADASSVAVLPFQAIGAGQDATLLAAGLHADLLIEVARVPQLSVISRMSVLPYEQTSLRPAQIAAELGVRTVLTGSIQVSGDRFRLAVELVDASAGRHMWAESYDADLHPRNLLAVQRDLAQDIAAVLSRTLTPDPAPTTHSLEAYRLVAEGRMQFDRKTEDGLASAVALFRRAVVLDPDYPPGWLGLAEALAMTADYGYGDRRDLLEAADAALVRCLALRPGGAEVHVPLGLIAEGRFDAPTALAEYATALRSIPGHADAHSWSAWVSLTVGDVSQAHTHARRAVRLNPLSAEAVSNLALALIAAGDPGQGLAEARRADALSPGYTTAAYYAGLALYDQGRYADAVEALHPLATAHADGLTTPWAGQAPDAALALAHVAAGDPGAARGVLATIDARTFPVEAGLVHLGLAEPDQAVSLFAGPIPPGYGSAMLFHLHFGDVWARARRPDVLAALGREIALAWQTTPR